MSPIFIPPIDTGDPGDPGPGTGGRSPFFDSIVTEDGAKRLIGIPGALVQVRNRPSGSAAVVYDEEVGGASSTDPFQTDQLGRFTKWVDPGKYSMDVVIGETLHEDAFAFDASVGGAGGTAAIPDVLDLAPSVMEPMINMTPKSGGMFFEFDQGVTGVPLSIFDPPQSNFYNNVVVGAAANVAASSLTYDNTNLLPGLPGSVRCSSLGGSGALYCTCADPDFIATSDHYGSLYIRLDTANTSPFRFYTWSTDTGTTCGFLRVETSRKLAFYNRNSALVATATLPFDFGGSNWYRIEWHLSGTAAADVEIRIYDGHSTVLREPAIVLTNVDLRDERGTIFFGNAGANVLAGHDFQLAAIAECGTDWFGPFGSAPRCVAARIVGADGVTLYEIHTDGSFLKRTDRTINQQPGGSTHGQNHRGTTIFKIDPIGSLMVGSNRNYMSSVDFQVSKLSDIFLNAQTGRVHAQSLDLGIYNDPSDIAFTRKFPMGTTTDRLGNGAGTVAGSARVTFTDLKFELLDVGRYMTIGGVGCHILELDGPTSAIMDHTFTANGSGLAWLAKEHPYPGNRMRGADGTGSHIGQIRMTIPFTPAIRESTIGIVTIAGAVISRASHKLVAGDPVVFTTTGTLPTPLVAGTTYFVSATGLTGGQFQVAASVGGTPIVTSGTQSPTHTVGRPLAAIAANSTTIGNMWGFTAADIGRALLFDSDFPFGEFVISAVNTTLGTVTAAKATGGAPLAAKPAASWMLSGGKNDPEVRVDWQPFTMVFGSAGGGARSWVNDQLHSCPSKVDFQLSTNDTDEDDVGIGLSSGGGAHTVMTISGGDLPTIGRGVWFGGHAWVIEKLRTLGYKNGVGLGTKGVQPTSKTTDVTVNAGSGVIQTAADPLAASTSIGFRVLNSMVTADDTISLNVRSIFVGGVESARQDTYQADVTAVANGSFRVRLQNWSGVSQSDAVLINFAIVKGAGML